MTEAEEKKVQEELDEMEDILRNMGITPRTLSEKEFEELGKAVEETRKSGHYTIRRQFVRD